ncbi:MAG: hypothetical protein GY913_22020 [Proteobacteria bacterium]|nr:hypothetical protein [Pseudomonadota bacterium]MCP4919589.1 hypothetical protein [Pseudomonadota bacterium]
MSRLFQLSCLGIALLGGWGAHLAQQEVDVGRREADAQRDLLVMPSAQATRVATLDLHGPAAAVMWVRSVLEFGEKLGRWSDPEWQRWFSRMIETTVTLDPAWRTPFFFGGVMLRVAGNAELSTDVFVRGHESFPDDSYFPFAAGMNAYLLDEDYDEAARWLLIAAELPDAPDWYRISAATIKRSGEDRPTAVRYLREEVAQTSDPALRSGLLARIATLEHDEYSERLTDACRRYERDHGVWPEDLELLVEAGLAVEIPPDPLGGVWVEDVGFIVSDTVRALSQRSRRRKERNMLRWRAR